MRDFRRSAGYHLLPDAPVPETPGHEPLLRGVLDGPAIIFTDNAVKYTKKDFAEHFFNVFTSEFEDDTFGKENIQNILAGVPFDYYSDKHLKLDNKSVFSVIQHINSGKIFDSIYFTNGNKPDIIDLSNIGDWIPYNELQDVINAAYNNLGKGGVLVMRKLLGDYDLKETMALAGFRAHYEEDTSHFYPRGEAGSIINDLSRFL